MKAPGAPWSPGEAASVNEFLNSPVGMRWLRELFARKPKVDYSSVERAALSGSYAAGYERAWEEISNTRVGKATTETASAKGIDPTKD